uniref:Uncharacterized protein n=1 Tax=Sphaerodactylus townsendi TaxID=933632 RepID=A0ACB8G6L7_9SAUR
MHLRSNTRTTPRILFSLYYTLVLDTRDCRISLESTETAEEGKKQKAASLFHISRDRGVSREREREEKMGEDRCNAVIKGAALFRKHPHYIQSKCNSPSGDGTGPLTVLEARSNNWLRAQD